MKLPGWVGSLTADSVSRKGLAIVPMGYLGPLLYVRGEYVVVPAGHTPHKSKSGILIGGEYIRSTLGVSTCNF